jgi:hypothetical protein
MTLLGTDPATTYAALASARVQPEHVYQGLYY